jgi:hypothetical protein
MKTINLTNRQTKDIKSIYGLWDFCLANISQSLYFIVDEVV